MKSIEVSVFRRTQFGFVEKLIYRPYKYRRYGTPKPEGLIGRVHQNSRNSFSWRSERDMGGCHYGKATTLDQAIQAIHKHWKYGK